MFKTIAILLINAAFAGQVSFLLRGGGARIVLLRMVAMGTAARFSSLLPGSI